MVHSTYRTRMIPRLFLDVVIDLFNVREITSKSTSWLDAKDMLGIERSLADLDKRNIKSMISKRFDTIQSTQSLDYFETSKIQYFGIPFWQKYKGRRCRTCSESRFFAECKVGDTTFSKIRIFLLLLKLFRFGNVRQRHRYISSRSEKISRSLQDSNLKCKISKS